MIKKNIYGDDLKAQLKAASNDRIYSFILAGGKIRGAFVNGTRMIREMRANHELGILETLVLGHAYLGCSLLTANLKGEDRVAIGIECSGPVKGLSVEANACGEVRGYLLRNPIPVDAPLEDFNLSPFFGAGFFTVTKYLEDAKKPFSGQVVLQHGNIAQDLAYYFLTSEQTPTAFDLSVKFDGDGEVKGAGGLFLQVMPGADEDMIEKIEELVKNIPSIGEQMAIGEEPNRLIESWFADYSPQNLADERVEFFCRCSKDAMARYMTMLPEKDLGEMLENGPFPVRISCHNCSTAYDFSRDDMEKIYTLAGGKKDTVQ